MLIQDLLPLERRPAATRVVRLSPEFRKAAAEFGRCFPQMAEVLEQFIDHRLTREVFESFGPRDGLLTRNLRGYRHCHLVRGKAVLIYRIGEAHLDLMTIIDHMALNAAGGRAQSLRNRLDRMTLETPRP